MLQGERKMALDNRTLGRFHLDGLPPAPRGMPQIEVAFDIDANGILDVSAKDKATEKEQSIRIEASSGLSDGEIDRMVKDAKGHEAEDQRKKDEIDARNRADQLVYETEKNLKEMGDKLNPDTKAKIEAAIGRTKEAIKGSNTDEIKSATDALTQAWHEAAGQMYAEASKQQEAQAGAGPEPGPQPGQAPPGGEEKKDESGAVDADFEVVD